MGQTKQKDKRVLSSSVKRASARTSKRSATRNVTARRGVTGRPATKTTSKRSPQSSGASRSRPATDSPKTIVKPSSAELESWGLNPDGTPKVRRNEFQLSSLAVNERRELGSLPKDKLRQLKWARQKYHYRNPDKRVAIHLGANGAVTVWRLR